METRPGLSYEPVDLEAGNLYLFAPLFLSGPPRRADVVDAEVLLRTALWTRGAYFQYVSTAKGRERRWRLFSTFPLGDTTKPVLVSELTFRATDRLVLKPTLHIIESRLPYKWANAIQRRRETS